MLRLRQLISQVLVIQLLVGCSPDELSVISKIPTPTVQPADTMQINGMISQVLKSLSNLVLPEAVAAEGSIKLYDLSNPVSPIEIYSGDVTGSDAFSITLKRSEASGKLLKASFTSNEDIIESRDIIFEIQGNETQVDASMNEDLGLQAKIIEAQLQYEVNQGELKPGDIKDRFRLIKEDPISDISDLLGDKVTILQLSQNPDSMEIFKDIAVQYKRAQKNSDETAKAKLRQRLFELGKNIGAIKTDTIMHCNGDSGYFLFQNRTFNVFAVGDQPELWKKFGNKIVFDQINSSSLANDIFLTLAGALTDISLRHETKMSAVLYFEPVDGIPSDIKSCRIFGQESADTKLKVPEDYPIKANLELFEEIDYTSYDSYDQVRSPIINTYYKIINEFYRKLEAEGLDPDIKNMILSKEIQLTLAEMSNKSKESFIYYNPSKYPDLKYGFDNQFFDVISYSQVDSIEQGESFIASAFDKSSENFRYSLKFSGLEDSVQEEIFNEQVQIAKRTLDLRMKCFHWTYSNFRI